MRTALLLSLVLVPLVVSAEKLNLKTGLWEVVATSEMSGMPPLPKELLDSLTPEQRAELQAKIKGSGEHTETSRECITERDLERPFDASNPEECKPELVRSTRTTQEYKLTCVGEQKGSGTFKINAPTPETMTGALNVSVGEGENVMAIKADMKGRWLGSECGEEADEEEYEDEEEMEE